MSVPVDVFSARAFTRLSWKRRDTNFLLPALVEGEELEVDRQNSKPGFMGMGIC
jgi:hypothetical protein|tara:strand:+ start:221 stop:382 length:162 start_codon:yes stop_codon:yes gene_type:complete